MSTAPWSPAAIGRLASTLRHVHRLIAHTAAGDVALDVVTGTLTGDEDAAPRWQMRLACRVPTSQAILDALDPRRGVTVTVMAGYVINGREDVHRLGTLDLLEAVVRRPGSDLMLTLGTREVRLTENVSTITGPSWDLNTDASTALKWIIQTFDPGASVDAPPVLGRFVTGMDITRLNVGDSPWSLVQAIADRVGVDVWDDGRGQWHIAPTAALAGVTKAWLSVGAAGSITASESARSAHDGFANTVVVKHEYRTDSGPQESVGTASVATGPFSVAAIGRRAVLVTIPYRGTTADAEATAAVLARRAVSRGRSLSIEAAHAPYWVVPGDTIQVQLVTGPASRHIVSRLDIDLPSGRWHVTTRLPEDVTITEGE